MHTTLNISSHFIFSKFWLPKGDVPIKICSHFLHSATEIKYLTRRTHSSLRFENGTCKNFRKVRKTSYIQTVPSSRKQLPYYQWFTEKIWNLLQKDEPFLGVSVRPRKAPINFVMFVHLSVFPQVWTDVRKIWYLGLLGRYVKGLPKFVNIGENVGHFTWSPKYVFILPTTLNLHNSPPWEWNGIRLLGQRQSEKHLANALLC